MRPAEFLFLKMTHCLEWVGWNQEIPLFLLLGMWHTVYAWKAQERLAFPYFIKWWWKVICTQNLVIKSRTTVSHSYSLQNCRQEKRFMNWPKQSCTYSTYLKAQNNYNNTLVCKIKIQQDRGAVWYKRKKLNIFLCTFLEI